MSIPPNTPDKPASPDNPDKLLTVAEAAQRFGLSASFLNKARMSGSGPHFVKLGAAVRYRVASITAWIEARTFATTAEAEAASAG